MNTHHATPVPTSRGPLQLPLAAAGARTDAITNCPPSQAEAGPTLWALANGSCRALRPDTWGLRLQVVRGRAWVTVEDDPGDHVLTAGQVLPLPPGLLAVAEAWGAEGAVLLVGECHASGVAQGGA